MDKRGTDQTNRQDSDDSQNLQSPDTDQKMTDFGKMMKLFENTDLIRVKSPTSPTSSTKEVARSSKPIVPAKSEKRIWLSEMKRRGITHTFDLKGETLFPHVQSYALFFDDHSRLTSSENWLVNLQFFLQLVSKNSNDADDENQLSVVFYLVELRDVTEDVVIKKFVRGKLVSDNVIKETKETNTAKNASQVKYHRGPPPANEALSQLAYIGAEFEMLEVGIGLPLAVLREKKCLVLEAELPPTLSSEQSSHLTDRITFITNMIQSVNSPRDNPYKFHVIQRYDSSKDSNYAVAVRQYINGSLVNEDMYSEYEMFLKLCLIRIKRGSNDQKDSRLPRRKAFLEIPCPCSDSKVRRWSCANCLEDVIYGYDWYLYCLCGKSKVNSKQLSFRCDEKSHGSRFKSSPAQLKTYLDRLQPIEEINILILGETGVGKSTFINSFVNYFSFSSLEEASDSDLLALIPTSFTVVDDKMEERVASTGVDENEVLTAGASATQSCRSYVIRHGDRFVHLIDTPGIGDVRGIECDTKNFENIMSFISHFDTIHGICVLLKPNLSRLSTIFQFCVKGLLCQLHKSASENIMFLFPSTKGTYYKPGDTLPILRSLLEGIRVKEPNVTIPLNQDNIFCFDSEAFRYLVAINSGIEFSEENRRNFQQSWERSAFESRRVLERVIKLKPHVVTDTLSLSQCRKMIIDLWKPLTDISQNIQHNIALLEEHRNRLTKTTEDLSILNQKLYVPVLDFETKILDEPRTVCASPSCVETFTVNGINKINYKTVCHDPCYMKATSEAGSNCSEMLECWAMNGTSNCRICGCDWKCHIHIHYELEYRTLHSLNVDIQCDLHSKESLFKSIRYVIEECEKRQKALEDEQSAITNACAKFAHFMKRNAITPYNDKIEDYLKYLLEVEKMNSSAPDNKQFRHLEKLQKEYKAQIKILEDSMKGQTTSGAMLLEPSDIMATINGLHRLTIYGDDIKKMGNIMQNATRNEHNASAFNSMASVTVTRKKRNMFKKISEIEAKSPRKSTGVFFLRNRSKD